MAVPEDLDERSVPKAGGRVELPLHIRWSGPPITYDLGDRAGALGSKREKRLLIKLQRRE